MGYAATECQGFHHPSRFPIGEEVTPAEVRFKKLVCQLHRDGIMPTPTAILVNLDRSLKSTGAGGPMLNGREAKWRTEIMTELGYRKHPITLRWVHPDHEFARDLREYEDTHREVEG